MSCTIHHQYQLFSKYLCELNKCTKITSNFQRKKMQGVTPRSDGKNFGYYRILMYVNVYVNHFRSYSITLKLQKILNLKKVHPNQCALRKYRWLCSAASSHQRPL